MDKLVNEVIELMEGGEYNPHRLFHILYHKHPVHYSKVWDAVHEAKNKGVK